MTTLKISAVLVEDGYIMRAANGELPQEGRVHTSRQSVYADCELMYNNSTWVGHKVHSGYQITI